MLVELSVVEQRTKAVYGVLDRATVTEVAMRYGMTRRTLHSTTTGRTRISPRVGSGSIAVAVDSAGGSVYVANLNNNRASVVATHR